MAAAALVGVALTCLASLRKLERERQLLARLRDEESGALPLKALDGDERHTAQGLERAGVVQRVGKWVAVKPAQLAAFRARRLRVLLSGCFIALVLVSMVMLIFMRK